MVVVAAADVDPEEHAKNNNTSRDFPCVATVLPV